MLLTGGERILLVIGIVTTYNRSEWCLREMDWGSMNH